MHTIGIDEYKKWGQLISWATQDQYKMLFTADLKRHRRTEQIVARLTKRGELVSQRWGKKLAYAVPRMKNAPLEHGLGCTDTLVRIWRSDPRGTIIQERFFRGLGSVPDWGIKYGEGLLLCEFSTENNFNGARIIKTKITKYYRNYQKILEKFNARNLVVLFVLDIPRVRILNFVIRNNVGGLCLLTDYETFKSVPVGQQLNARIYIDFRGETGPIKESK